MLPLRSMPISPRSSAYSRPRLLLLEHGEQNTRMKAKVSVPASTSNLGGGFDCIGVAVDRWLTAAVVVGNAKSVQRVTMIRSGAVANLAQSAEDDLVHFGYTLACNARSHPVPSSVEYEVRSTIPVARGLGASAAALVAGAFLARDSLAL